MEVYAGALSYADNQVGRLLDAVQESGQLDNTLVIFIMGDNGASAEGTLQGTTNEVAEAANGVKESLPYLLLMIDQLGGPLTYNHYPGWLGARHGYPDAVDEADCVALGRHTQWHGDLVARLRSQFCQSSISCRPSMKVLGSRLRQ